MHYRRKEILVLLLLVVMAACSQPPIAPANTQVVAVPSPSALLIATPAPASVTPTTPPATAIATSVAGANTVTRTVATTVAATVTPINTLTPSPANPTAITTSAASLNATIALSFSIPYTNITAALLSPDGRYVFAMGSEGKGTLLELPGVQSQKILSQEIQFTGIPAFYSFAWSPDSTHILYNSNDLLKLLKQSDIWIYDLNQKTATNLTKFMLENPVNGTFDPDDLAAKSVYAPAWSPDGKQIVYAKAGDDGHSTDIWTMNADGSNRQRRFVADPDYRWGTYWLDWLPDGTHLLFNRSRTQSQAPENGFYIATFDGKSIKQVTQGLAGMTLVSGGSFSVDPKGEYFIAEQPFMGYNEGAQNSAVLVNITTGTQKRLPVVNNEMSASELQNTFAHNAAWSPDGSKILYLQSDPNHWQLILANRDLSGAKIIFSDQRKLSAKMTLSWAGNNTVLILVDNQTGLLIRLDSPQR